MKLSDAFKAIAQFPFILIITAFNLIAYTAMWIIIGRMFNTSAFIHDLVEFWSKFIIDYKILINAFSGVVWGYVIVRCIL